MRILILGAGISGLALAYRLAKEKKNEVLVLEKEERAGGWIKTETVDGFLFEQGPRSLRPFGEGVKTLELIEELGLQKEVAAGGGAAKTRYLCLGGRLVPLPGSLFGLIKSPLTRTLLPRLLREPFIKKSPYQDESIAAFFSRRFGKKAADLFADPMTKGIYAGDPSKLSVRSCFPDLYLWEQNYGSVLRGLFSKKRKKEPLSPFIRNMQKESLFSFKGGMERLSRTLAEKSAATIRFGSAAASLFCDKNGAAVTLENGETVEGDMLFSTVSSEVLSDLVREMDSPLAESLSSIAAASLATVNLGYNSALLPCEGFGYLVPSSENENILGAVFDSSAFPEQNSRPQQTRLTVMLGGGAKADLLKAPPDALKTIALEAVKRHLGIDKPPDAAHVAIARGAVPQYHLGHDKKVLAIEQRLARRFPRLRILGSSFHGVSVNACIANALNVIAKKDKSALH